MIDITEGETIESAETGRYLVAELGIIEDVEHGDSAESDTRSTVAPARLAFVARRAHVTPVRFLGHEEASLIGKTVNDRIAYFLSSSGGIELREGVADTCRTVGEAGQRRSPGERRPGAGAPFIGDPLSEEAIGAFDRYLKGRGRAEAPAFWGAMKGEEGKDRAGAAVGQIEDLVTGNPLCGEERDQLKGQRDERGVLKPFTDPQERVEKRTQAGEAAEP
jgi:hypothetical protein